MYSSSRHNAVEGGKTCTSGWFRSRSSNKRESSLVFLIAEAVFRCRRDLRGCREQISLERRRRDWSRFRSEKLGDTKDTGEGRRFLGGNACGETAIDR